METLNEMKCPLCHEIVYSEISKGCMMCGMPLEDEGKDFCSGECRRVYLSIKNKER